MAGRAPSARLRSTLDKVLVHDVKNISFRLRLLLSNLDEHWEDPDFRRTVKELLASSVERLEGAVGRLVAEPDAVLIKVSLDVNGLLQEVVQRPARRGRSGRGPSVRLALGAVPRIWGDPFYLGDALASLLDNASEAAAPDGKVLARTFSGGTARRPRVVLEIIDNGAGMTPEFLRDRLFRAFETTKPEGVGLGLATARQIVRFHRGTIRILSHPGGGTLVRLSFPANPGESA
ncbi:MAG TPA: HAMP domain-containing sensor histidine kinase [Thermoanaerobaculia bacterium]|jgi:signal transduction histidine kinase|nr:HAMP domain-containing sensor histidine kinase [Thermoanaerobaculia bacterium]